MVPQLSTDEKRARNDDDYAAFGVDAAATYMIDGQPACWGQQAAPDSNEQPAAPDSNDDVMVGPSEAPAEEYADFAAFAAQPAEMQDEKEARRLRESSYGAYGKGKQIARRPVLQLREREQMLAGMLRDDELFAIGQQHLPPTAWARCDLVYAALWMTAIELHTRHGCRPGVEALCAGWEARLAAVATETFGKIELDIANEFLTALPSIDRASIAPAVVKGLMQHYVEDQLATKFADVVDRTKYTPCDLAAHLDQMRDELAEVAAINADDNPADAAVSIDDLLDEDIPDQTYFIDSLLADPGPVGIVGNRIAFLAGPLKSLKTRIEVAMAIALATGSRFLGSDRFPVREPTSVLLVCAESGKRTIRDQCAEVLTSIPQDEIRRPAGPVTRSGKPPKLPLHLRFTAVTLTDQAGEAWLRRNIVATRARVVFVDPFYFSLLGAGSDTKVAADLHAMGAMFQRLSRLADELGVLFVLCHHAGKTAIKAMGNAPMDLIDLHGAGVGEAASQWLLINRRCPYDDTCSDRLHSLWLRFGGRQGHAGLVAADITEGPITRPVWQVEVKSPAELRAELANVKAAAEADADAAKDYAVGRELWMARTEPPHGLYVGGKTGLLSRLGGKETKLAESLERLEQRGLATGGWRQDGRARGTLWTWVGNDPPEPPAAAAETTNGGDA